MKRRLFGLLKKRRNHLGSLSMDYRVPPSVEEGHPGGGAFFLEESRQRSKGICLKIIIKNETQEV